MKIPILIVEDDEKTRMALSYRLAYAGYHVTQSSSGKQAIALLEQQTFSVVLTDLVLGDVDGITVLHAARRQPYRPMVILLTGHATLDTSIAALREGAHDYVQKPCPEEQLLECIDHAIQRYNAERCLLEATQMIASFYHRSEVGTVKYTESSDHSGTECIEGTRVGILRVGELCVGPSREDVWFAGQHIAVTPTEYAFLRLLAQCPGVVQPYSTIVLHTHHLNVNNSDAQTLLKTHVRNLRRKLHSTYLVNHRGVGYKLVDPTLFP